MFRLNKDGIEWIMIFSQGMTPDEEEKEAAYRAIMLSSSDLSDYSHGESLIIFDNIAGAIVIRVEKIPSFLLAILALVPREHWFPADVNKSC